MFTQFFTVVSVAMLALAGAVPPQGQCNVGSVQCCNSVQSADSDAASQLLALVGAVVQGAAVQVGITCSPITVIGLGAGSSCTAQPVCCENNNFNGVVAIGCTPINIGL